MERMGKKSLYGENQGRELRGEEEMKDQKLPGAD